MNKNLRKIRKLIRYPKRFFLDAFEKKSKLSFGSGKNSSPASASRGTVRAARRYSVVVAVFKAENYLDDFFDSLVEQTVDFESSIELVMVDDDSPDESARVIKKWSDRYPNNIRYFHKENGGQASARNLGLQFMTGDWVTFIDPDDFVSKNYFEEVESLLHSTSTNPALVACKLVFYFESRKIFSNSHPLRHLFSRKRQIVDMAGSDSHMQLSGSSAFFDAAVIRDDHLRFDKRIRPTFEDAHFIALYLSRTPHRPAAFLGDAHYYYRKRGDASSTVDTSWECADHYGAALDHGVLHMLRHYQETHGRVPEFIQRTAFYQVLPYFKKFLNKDSLPAFLAPCEVERFDVLIKNIFAYIDQKTIEKFSLLGIWFFHRVAIIENYKKSTPSKQIFYISKIDTGRKLFQVQYFSKLGTPANFLLNDQDCLPIFESSRTHTFAGKFFIMETTAWLPLTEATLKIRLSGEAAALSLGGKQSKILTIRQIRDFFHQKKTACDRKGGMVARLLKRTANLSFIKNKYHQAWLVMDQDFKADDNGEHLYRYLRANRPEINAWFVLSPRSTHWNRLEKEGFRLAAFGGLRHKLLLLNCIHVVSSHIDDYLINVLPRAKYGSSLHFRVSFLQHGIITCDLSNYLNSKDLDLIVTSSDSEYLMLTAPSSSYKFSDHEVVLTGLPRHDNLHRAAQPEKVILVMPTWRRSLCGEMIAGSADRSYNPHFENSAFFLEWNALFHDEDFLQIVRDENYQLIFFPHANLHAYLHLFDLPEEVRIVSTPQGSMQDLFRRSAALITDYSSVACEFALMRKPVLYFQFDRNALENGGHSYRPGDFAGNGFGPVCECRADLAAALRILLRQGGTMAEPYQARCEKFFAFQDANNCERVTEAILALDRPYPARSMPPEQYLSRIEQSYQEGEWRDVLHRCAALDDRPRTPAAYRRRAALFRAYAQYAVEFPQASKERRTHRARTGAGEVSIWRKVVNDARQGSASEYAARHRLLGALIERKDYIAAVGVAERIAEVAPIEDMPLENYARLACLASENGAENSAADYALRVVDLSRQRLDHPGTWNVSVRYAMLIIARSHERRRDDLKAMSIVIPLLRIDPENEQAAAMLNRLLNRQSAPDADTLRMEQSACFHDALPGTARLSSAEGDVALCLASLCRQKGDLGVAAEITASLLIERTRDPFVHLESGELALREGRWQEAGLHFETAWKTAWGPKVARLKRGLLLSRHRMERLQDCWQLAEASLATYPDDFDVMVAHMDVAAHQERWADVKKSATTGFATCGEKPVSLQLKIGKTLFLALRRTHSPEQALAHIEELRKRHPYELDLLKDSAELAFSIGKYELAALNWERVAEHAATLAERRRALRRRAEASWWKGDQRLARAILLQELEASAFAALAKDEMAETTRLLAAFSLNAERIAEAKNFPHIASAALDA